MDHTYTVAELSEMVDRALRRAIAGEVWVEGEIRDLRRSPNQPHVYFTLADPDEPEHRLRIVLFSRDRSAVNRYLMRSGAVRMTDGVHVRIRGEIGYHSASGYIRLRMTWIDPEHTLGKLEAERRALLARLEAAGHLRRNARLPSPVLPLRIGFITSVGSAAHADFLHELGNSHYGFQVTVAHASVQGINAPTQIVEALERLRGIGVDLVAIVRGGGAQTDLAAFDAESVALAVAGTDVPVWVGIGHEIDTTVIDHVAGRSFKTPTACAAAIVGVVRGFDDRLRRSLVGIGTSAAGVVQRASTGTAHAVAMLRLSSRRHVAAAEAHLASTIVLLHHAADEAPRRAEARLAAISDDLATHVHQEARSAVTAVEQQQRQLVRSVRRSVDHAVRRIDTVDTVVRAHDPERMLRRGWSITRHRGRVVGDPADVAVGDDIDIETAGGTLHSRITRLGGDDSPDQTEERTSTS